MLKFLIYFDSRRNEVIDSSFLIYVRLINLWKSSISQLTFVFFFLSLLYISFQQACSQ